MYNACLKKRRNIIVQDEKQKAMALIRRVVYGLSIDTEAIWFLLRKLMRKEEPNCFQCKQMGNRRTE